MLARLEAAFDERSAGAGRVVAAPLEGPLDVDADADDGPVAEKPTAEEVGAYLRRLEFRLRRSLAGGEALPEPLQAALRKAGRFLAAHPKWVAAKVGELRAEGAAGEALVEALTSAVRTAAMKRQARHWAAAEGCTRDQIQQRLTEVWLRPEEDVEFPPCSA